jgi:lipopolysaccharide transport system permease protein
MGGGRCRQRAAEARDVILWGSRQAPPAADARMEPTPTVEALRDQATEQTAATTPAPTGAGGRPRATLEEVHPGIRPMVREAWEDLRVVRMLGSRFLAKYVAGTKLGSLWLIIRPLMDSVGKTILFGGVLKVKAPGGVPYYLFLMSGLLAWRLPDRAFLYAARSFGLYRKIMKTFRFPLILVPIAAMAYPAVEAAVYLVVFLGAVVVFWVVDGTLYLQPFPQILLIFPGALLLFFVTAGIGLWLSVLNAKARDVRFTLRFILPVWLYVTPVVYPVSKLPSNYRWIAIVNPMSAPVEIVKSGLVGSAPLEPAALICSVSVGAVLLVSGLWFFGKEAARSVEQAVAGVDEDDGDEA